MPEDPSDEIESDAVLCQHLSSRLLEGVAASRAVLLLQTHSAYTDALTLLELYWAIRQKKTIICLRLQDSPYDFSEVLACRTNPRTLANIDPERTNPRRCPASSRTSSPTLCVPHQPPRNSSARGSKRT